MSIREIIVLITLDEHLAPKSRSSVACQNRMLWRYHLATFLHTHILYFPHYSSGQGPTLLGIATSWDWQQWPGRLPQPKKTQMIFVYNQHEKSRVTLCSLCDVRVDPAPIIRYHKHIFVPATSQNGTKSYWVTALSISVFTLLWQIVMFWYICDQGCCTVDFAQKPRLGLHPVIQVSRWIWNTISGRVRPNSREKAVEREI